MEADPYTLTVAMSKSGWAKGCVYVDDGKSFEFQKGAFTWKEFEMKMMEGEGGEGGKPYVLTSRDKVLCSPSEEGARKVFEQEIASVQIEKIIILGLASSPKGVFVKNEDGSEVELKWIWEDGKAAGGSAESLPGCKASVLTLHEAGLFVAKNWSVVIE
jgi:alpha 1,3-glucosidase